MANSPNLLPPTAHPVLSPQRHQLGLHRVAILVPLLHCPRARQDAPGKPRNFRVFARTVGAQGLPRPLSDVPSAGDSSGFSSMDWKEYVQETPTIFKREGNQWGPIFHVLQCLAMFFLISYAYFCTHSYLYLISSRLFIPVGPHKAVVEVSNIGHYSRGELL